jgi:hypothetical protein
MVDMPQELGVFLLPQTVLFPDALLPLHVFEPRYQALVQDACSNGGLFVMAVAKPEGSTEPGVPEMYPIACVGRIIERELLADGCSDVIVRGEIVVGIEERKSARPYRVVTITPLPLGRSFGEDPGCEERCRELRRLLEGACPGCVAALKERWPRIFDAKCCDELLHTVAMHLPVRVELKVDWLACAGSLPRWEKLRSTMLEMGAARDVRQRALGRYQDLLPENPAKN